MKNVIRDEEFFIIIKWSDIILHVPGLIIEH